MPYKKPRINWTSDNGIAYDDLNRIEGNIRSLGVIPVASGTGTVITLDLDDILNMETGTIIQFIANANNGGASTKINNRYLYKPGSTVTPKLIKDKAYSAWYNKLSDCFFLKASAEGTALASQVKKNYSFSNDDDTGIVGTLDLSNLISGNIRSGVTIDGVVGKASVVDTAGANGISGAFLSGYSGYVNGLKILGSIPIHNNSAYIAALDKKGGAYSAGDANIYGYIKPAAGYYDGSAWARIAQPDLKASNILSSKNIMGVVGSIPVYSNANVNAVDKKGGALTSGDTTVYGYIKPTAGYYDGSAWARIAQPDLKATNILASKNIMGVVGNIPVPSAGSHVNALDKKGGALTAGDATVYGYIKPAAGYYDGSVWARIAQPDLKPENILSPKTIMGVVGTIPDNSNAHTPCRSVGLSPQEGRVYFYPDKGYYDGFKSSKGIYVIEPTLKPENIKKGTTILGCEGSMDLASMGGRKIWTGMVTAGASELVISDLGFLPRMLFATCVISTSLDKYDQLSYYDDYTIPGTASGTGFSTFSTGAGEGMCTARVVNRGIDNISIRIGDSLFAYNQYKVVVVG